MFFLFNGVLRQQLHNLASEKWPSVNADVAQRMGRMAAASAWGLGINLNLFF